MLEGTGVWACLSTRKDLKDENFQQHNIGCYVPPWLRFAHVTQPARRGLATRLTLRHTCAWCSCMVEHFGGPAPR